MKTASSDQIPSPPHADEVVAHFTDVSVQGAGRERAKARDKTPRAFRTSANHSKLRHPDVSLTSRRPSRKQRSTSARSALSPQTLASFYVPPLPSASPYLCGLRSWLSVLQPRLRARPSPRRHSPRLGRVSKVAARLAPARRPSTTLSRQSTRRAGQQFSAKSDATALDASRNPAERGAVLGDDESPPGRAFGGAPE